MRTQQAQIKVNLPLPMKEFLESKAQQYGMPIAGYLKHLIMQDIKTLDYPTFRASERTEKAYHKAMEEIDQAVDADVFFGKFHK